MGKASAPDASMSKRVAGKERLPAKKSTSEANLGPSLITLQKLNEMVEEGILPP